MENDSVSAMKRSASKSLTLILALSAALAVAGCSTHQETTQTTSTTTPAYTDDSTPPPQTTTTTTTTSNEPDSVVGSVFHTVGTVILFPFRLIGDALGLLV
jgi:ABC-type oligopeptide transport system substrate-binding subunit